MTTKLKWRLSSLPTPSELRELVKDKILTQEEAREILFSKEKEEEKSVEDLKSEVKFLRELVEKLSNHKPSTIIEVIKTIETPIYIRQPWYQPYYWYSSTSGSNIALCSTTSGNASFTNVDSNYSGSTS